MGFETAANDAAEHWSSEEPEVDKSALDDSDMDALHILPLQIVPLETKGLAKARMIKNIRLESVVEVFNDRGRFQASARISDAARPGLVVGLSIWWPKLCPGGRNANAVTSQELTDLGGGATFYDALVEVKPA